MRGVFDEREPERVSWRRGSEAAKNGSEKREDREVTLGWFTLMAIFGGLLVLCGLSFGLGYVAGGREPNTASTPAPAAAMAQLDGTRRKSSAAEAGEAGATLDPAPQDLRAGIDQAAGRQDTEPSIAAAARQAGHDPQPSSRADVAAAQQAAGDRDLHGTQRAAPASIASAQQQQAAKPVETRTEAPARPAPAAVKDSRTISDATAVVQIATLEREEDAAVLVDALRRRGYAVTAGRDAGDGMVHVRVGPFASRAVANQWSRRLLNDGYNAVVQSR